jgi:branched-chain amino acid transport system ATP-binding protein
MEKDIILQVNNITKSFGGIKALDKINFTMKKGELLGIIGPNGSGKTTLINIITGFIRPDHGRIIYKGKDITGMRPYKIANMGIIRSFQFIRPFYNIPAYKNVVIPLCSKRVRKIKGGEYGRRDEVALDLLEEMGFERDSHVPYKETSNLPHGYLKRLELARCIALQPELLILDEIFSGMSKPEVASTSPIIEKLHDNGFSIIMIEHRIKELFQIANRVIVLNFGEKIADAPPSEIIKKEEVKVVYIGDMKNKK